ncbi:hypothetical protein [Rhodoplanes serenus]|uniref:hypothetical protein n=1 Tax=Rhodoplanes serenus TaxID=200615 RepID=UPI000DAF26EA|nr:hypothetical protein [Rhodoplanes serenus]RAI28421.1 hypothetical protein CH340_23625 [Rhodoplanes serenus]
MIADPSPELAEQIRRNGRSDDGRVIAQWGYRADESVVFLLAPGEELPEGWADRPARGYHPHDVAAGIPPEPAAPAAPGDAPDRQAAAPPPKKRKG